MSFRPPAHIIPTQPAKPCDSMWATCGPHEIAGRPHAAHMEPQVFAGLVHAYCAEAEDRSRQQMRKERLYLNT